MKSFIWGMLAMASLTIALFFLRFWRLAGERLLAYFSAAFVFMAASWVSLAAAPEAEARKYVYLPRLFAFVLLIAGIVDANRRARKPGSP